MYVHTFFALVNRGATQMYLNGQGGVECSLFCIGKRMGCKNNMFERLQDRIGC